MARTENLMYELRQERGPSIQIIHFLSLTKGKLLAYNRLFSPMYGTLDLAECHTPAQNAINIS